MRHTFAAWAIESAQIELSYFARIMGTSVRELEDTCFRWLRRTDEQLLAPLTRTTLLARAADVAVEFVTEFDQGAGGLAPSRFRPR